MKQGEAESRRSETRPLNERDTWLESSGAFIMPQSTASASSGRAYVGGKAALFYHTRCILKFCYNATLCGRHLSNKKHNILKRLWCFQMEIEGVWRHIGRRRNDQGRVTI